MLLSKINGKPARFQNNIGSDLMISNGTYQINQGFQKRLPVASLEKKIKI